MNKTEVLIRPIAPRDNRELAVLIRSVLKEFGVPKTGTTYADKELDYMYEAFSITGATYFVAEADKQILGGAGVIHLKDEVSDICELQKMDVLKSARGMGIGSKLLKKCLQSATILGYKRCYLESMSNMSASQELYSRNGFRFLDHRMGATGHYVCPIWMIKELD
ncbi:MAG: GNAT family N-acetyltransferase [Flavobacteriaceae bacterium]